jgi:D-lactate dehydrogenase (cytochrome)
LPYKEYKLKFNSLSEADIKALQSIVDSDRFSTGESVLDLHAKDQSSHPRSRPDAVIWPLSDTEISSILKYANAHGIPITGWGSGSSLEGNPIAPGRAWKAIRSR